MLKIFQTGDNHIGLKYASHEKASVLTAARINAFENMVSIANQENCDLFVITGDLFENTYSISKRDVSSLLDMLSCFKGTVVVLPGNHDYYDKDAKVWQDFRNAAAGKDNIMLLTEYRPYSITVNGEDVVIYPAHCTSLHSEPRKNNLDWIKAENITPDSTYRIGIAHGAVQGETIDNEGQYFLMTRSELESIPVDVWLIGHTHVPFPANLTEDFSVCETILNAGTHVQTNVSCNTEGLCFVVEIDDEKKVRAKKVKTGTVRFYRKNITLTAGEMIAILDREIADIPDNSVVDLIFSGTVTAEEYDNRISEIEGRLSRFLEGTYDDNSLSRLISKDFIDAEFAETSFCGSLLTALLDEPKEAQLAYELLKSLKEGR
ncbi:MAG: metallophosphoesterase [Lachnospiraceae bacterium]|nr:metallophosphoesterase [Lachnospiraceae bacterium]